MSEPFFVRAGTIWEGWSQVAGKLAERGIDAILGCQVDIAEAAGAAVQGATERSLDTLLKSEGMPICRKVAKSIYPLRAPSCLHSSAMQVFDRMSRQCPHGVRRSYFDRLIGPCFGPIGQIEQLIAVINSGNHRSTALVLSTWNPVEDLNKQRRRGFPCLNSIHVHVARDTLQIRGVYPLQYAVPKLYGNLLGLRALGLHIAWNTSKTLTSFSCYASAEKRGDPFTKAHLRGLMGLGS